MKLVQSLLLLALLIGVAAFFLGDWIAKEIFESVVTRLTGFRTAADEFHLNPLKGTVRIERLVLFNPKGYEESVFADIAEIDLAIDLPAIIKKEQTRIYLLRLAIRELNIEKNREGISNVSLLKSTKPKEREKAEVKKEEKAPFYLDRFELTLRKVSYRDNSKIVPANITMDLKIENQVFEGINNPASIVNLILLKVLTASPFGTLGLNPAVLQQRLGETVSKTLTVGEELLVGQTTALARKAVGKTGETLGKAEELAREQLVGLLGKVRENLGEWEGGSRNQ